MANLPEKLIQQRLRLIHQSLDSPSNLPGSSKFRNIMETGVSPMTGLAMNLSDTSLGMTPSPPIQDSKRRLSMDDTMSSSSTPSPLTERCMSDSSESSCTPLSSIGNIPTKRLLLAQGPASSLTALKNISREESMEENKENLPLCAPVFSPCKMRSPLKLGRSPLKRQSPAKIIRGPGLGVSPIKPQSGFLGLGLPSGLRRVSGVKRPMFTVLEEDDTCSRDSGYNSQGLESLGGLDTVEPSEKARKKFRSDLDEMLADCSPGKDEEGIAPLANSPKESNADQCSDGFDLDQLPDMLNDSSEMESPRLGFNSLLSNKLVLPQHLASVPAFSDNQSDKLFVRKTSDQTQVRPMFRRALSMQEPSSNSPDSSNLLGDSPLSRTAGPLQLSGLKPGFKRPDPPTFRQDTALGVKKRRFGLACREEDANPTKKTSFVRSHSLNELSIMKSCQLKEEVENILPDSSRLYALPTISSGSKHPSLRSITCETLADLVMGKHNDLVESYRVVDVRYKFEYDGGHIVGAENWQHGEDDAFLSSFLPSQPLAKAPTHNVDNEEKRNILIFHCEFSSQRGPDFYMKLRERDRQLNKDVYPGLHYPECYLLHLGYKEFFRKYPSLCTGTYTQMTDPRHESDLRKMRAKSKSWSGGTVARTGRMGRLHL